MDRFLADRRVRYVAVGGFSSAVYYALFAALYLTTRHHLHYLALPVLANLGCAIATYPLQRRWVFVSKGPVLSGFLKFYVICLWAMLFTYAGLPLLVELAGVPVLVAQAVLIVTAPLVNYQLSKSWAFRR
ncbi:GtrA family protein [Dactylosporangium salmoneum]|uniref:GtrA/DPMS transmembrane domain-containing protein n=1 Tax=Dactylosporangium salmoneum TaxID=53361 RepID=A0ABP5SE37_9ACTN